MRLFKALANLQEYHRRKKVTIKYVEKMLQFAPSMPLQFGSIYSRTFTYRDKDNNYVDMHLVGERRWLGPNIYTITLKQKQYTMQVYSFCSSRYTHEEKFMDGYWFTALEAYCTSDKFLEREDPSSLVSW